jgi:hypothetical protein
MKVDVEDRVRYGTHHLLKRSYLGGGVQFLTLNFRFFAGGGAGFQVRAGWMKALLYQEREKVQYPAQKLGQRIFCPKPPSGWSEKFKSLILEKGCRLKKMIYFPDQEKVKLGENWKKHLF